MPVDSASRFLYWHGLVAEVNDNIGVLALHDVEVYLKKRKHDSTVFSPRPGHRILSRLQRLRVSLEETNQTGGQLSFSDYHG